jgi:acetoacetate decarboxylase
VGTLNYGKVRIAKTTMRFKHRMANSDDVSASLVAPNFLLKIIAHVDGTTRIC